MIVPPAARAPVVEAVKPWLQVAIEPALAGEAEKLATAEGVVAAVMVKPEAGFFAAVSDEVAML